MSRIHRVIMPRLDQVLCPHELEFSSVPANRDVLVDGTLVRPGTAQTADGSAPDGLQFFSRGGRPARWALSPGGWWCLLVWAPELPTK